MIDSLIPNNISEPFKITNEAKTPIYAGNVLSLKISEIAKMVIRLLSKNSIVFPYFS